MYESITAALFVLAAVVITTLIFRWVRHAWTSKIQQTETLKVSPVQLPLLVPDLPKDLVEACASGSCVLYAGAGLSAQAGYPTWNEFIHQLLDWSIENGFLERHVVESYRAEINAGAADSVADSIISKWPSNEKNVLNNYMRRVFLQKVKLPQAYNLLSELKFSAILTTNVDELLENTFSSERIVPLFTYYDTDELLSALTSGNFFILKLYGTLERPETVLVAQAQYEEAVSSNRDFSQFMDTLFFSRTLLFIGASLEGIEAYLRSVKLPRSPNRTHYALVAVRDNVWRSKTDTLERRYGIKVLPYTPSNGYPEVVEFLKRLKDQVKTQETAVTKTRRATTGLKKVILQNIGPFDFLELDLDHEWNILLGDNGVGKSSILRAISVAMVGERAQAYAGRLIKSGSTTEAFIILETGQGISYKSTLRPTKKGYDEAEVISEQARMLEAEGWLALGFPPLRMTNWQRLRGPETDMPLRSRVTPDDLLPLIKGEPDPRLDNLKQWIVNNDYWSKKGQRGERYAGLTQKLFDIINLLTYPLKTEFKEVNSDGRVMVETENDGPVPIEAISQGLSSLIGWVGVLLQRLYEIFDQEQDPLEKYALVLMDELDAHMHPAWQQALVPRLKEVFKNTQFIATTHSPLVAMGLPPNQVLRLMRNEDGEIEQLEVEPDMTMGRADQILTGELFNVPSARDLQTQAIIDRYSELAAREKLEEDEEDEFARLAGDLKIRMPSPAERKEARIAYEWISKALKDRIDALPSDEQKKVVAEMKVQLQEIITGCWRPQ